MRKYVKREKYVLREPGNDEDGAVLALQYDKKKGELMIAGPKQFMGAAQDLLEGYFDITGNYPSIYRNKMRWQISVDWNKWVLTKRELRKFYKLKEVTRFRRLTR